MHVISCKCGILPFGGNLIIDLPEILFAVKRCYTTNDFVLPSSKPFVPNLTVNEKGNPNWHPFCFSFRVYQWFVTTGYLACTIIFNFTWLFIMWLKQFCELSRSNSFSMLFIEPVRILFFFQIKCTCILSREIRGLHHFYITGFYCWCLIDSPLLTTKCFGQLKANRALSLW